MDCSFGSIKLYIPKHWRVEDKIHTMLGGVTNDVRLARPQEGAPQLFLQGSVQFGAIEIEYI